tara:strand:- start:125 stop:1069 length:945 start_codon:yes stop_codon:yes gene_type:complete
MGVYTNTSAFRRALLTSDIYSENLRETLRAAEIQKQIQEQAENRQANSYLGKLAGGALGFFAGGPAGASMGAGLGGSLGLNYDNTDYTDFMSSNPAEFMGKFYAAEGLQAYNTLKDYAEDMEDQQDSMNKAAALKLAFDAITMDFGDSLNMNKPELDAAGNIKLDAAGNPMMQKNWYEMKLGEKMNHFVDFKTGFNMQDFLGSMKKLTDPEKLAAALGDSASGIIDEGMVDSTNLFEKAFNNNVLNTLEEDINNVLGTVEFNVGIGNASVEDLNNSLLQLGHEPLSPDLFDIISVEETIDSNNFPEGFNWGIFK